MVTANTLDDEQTSYLKIQNNLVFNCVDRVNNTKHLVIWSAEGFYNTIRLPEKMKAQFVDQVICETNERIQHKRKANR